MKIGDSVRRTSREEVVIKSVIFNSIIDVFKTEKNIDVTDYLGSIKLIGNTIIVKTNKPIINVELLNLDDKIMEKCSVKFEKMGIKFEDFEIKYL